MCEKYCLCTHPNTHAINVLFFAIHPFLSLTLSLSYTHTRTHTYARKEWRGVFVHAFSCNPWRNPQREMQMQRIKENWGNKWKRKTWKWILQIIVEVVCFYGRTSPNTIKLFSFKVVKIEVLKILIIILSKTKYVLLKKGEFKLWMLVYIW